MKLSRNQILEGEYDIPENLVTLKYTDHFKKRADERGMQMDVFPTKVRVTTDNIYSGKTNENKKLTSVVVRLYYKSNRDMYLCFNPYNGSCISVWFRKRKGG